MKTIAITGSDGSGKSTVIREVIKSGFNGIEVSIWDAMDPTLFPDKSTIDRYLCTLQPDARTLFLAHAVRQSLAKRFSGKVLLLNGYIYKYLVSELGLGADENLVRSILNYMPKPDMVIFLEVDTHKAAQRKNTFSRYECGLKDPGEKNFALFQEEVKRNWAFFNKSSWISVDANREIGEVVSDVIEALK